MNNTKTKYFMFKLIYEFFPKHSHESHQQNIIRNLGIGDMNVCIWNLVFAFFVGNESDCNWFQFRIQVIMQVTEMYEYLR